jgi:hypothetical protein
MFPHFNEKSPAMAVPVSLVTVHWKFPHDFASGIDVETQLPRLLGVEAPEPPPLDPEPEPDPDPDPDPELLGAAILFFDSNAQPASSTTVTATTPDPTHLLFIATS